MTSIQEENKDDDGVCEMVVEEEEVNIGEDDGEDFGKETKGPTTSGKETF